MITTEEEYFMGLGVVWWWNVLKFDEKGESFPVFENVCDVGYRSVISGDFQVGNRKRQTFEAFCYFLATSHMLNERKPLFSFVRC